MTRNSLVLALLGLFCQLTVQAPGGDMRDYVFVLIRTGPVAQPSPEMTQKAMQGHFANMSRLAEAGKLLVAGPLGEPRAEPDLRGLWIFNAEKVDDGLELGRTDPAVEMGVFRLEGAVFRCADPLTELPRLEKEDEARRLADPDVPDQWEGRAYVIATAPAESKAAYTRGPGVLIDGVLRAATDNTITGDESYRMLVLDARTPDEAKALLGEDGWTLHGWYSSKTIAALPGLADEG